MSLSDDDDNDLPPLLTVFDLPQPHTRPSFSLLKQTLEQLAATPCSWIASLPTNTFSKTIDEAGIPSYLTRLIASPLSWLVDEEKEEIWETASRRLSERAGRAGMGAFTRVFNIPLDTPTLYRAAHDGKRSIQETRTIQIKIHEPALTGDHLGFKTWGAGYVMARLLPTEILKYSLSLEMDTTTHSRGQGVRILELGAGTGLAGIAAAALHDDATVHLTDLPAIIDNLHKNITTNAHLLNTRSVTAGVLDWSKLPKKLEEEEKYDIILAADSLYAGEHACLLAEAVATLLKQGEGRVFTVMPYRDVKAGYHEMLRTGMRARRLKVLDEGEEDGMEDWDDGSGGAVRFWWCVWGWSG